MSDDTARPAPGVDRRSFLRYGALPAAAALSGSSPAAYQSSAARGPSQPRQPSSRVRVGIIGAGANVRDVMIPAFRRIPECELLAVANTSLASSQRVATEFNIPRPYADWRALLADADVDAICIGTWPYMHRTLTLASLDAGKHVLCQARMANTAAEAREMLAASYRRPDLVCQLVPTSGSYRVDTLLRTRLADGFVGDVLSVEVQRLERGFANFDAEMDWRHSAEFSGLNIMTIGSTYESMMRWLGRGNRVMAMSRVHVPYRRTTAGARVSASMPDHLDILYELANGAQVHMRFSETTGLSSGNQTWIHGTEGTLYVDARQTVFGGRRGDSELRELPNPQESQAVYRVEREFINAVRGVEPVTMNPFETGVHYMEWTEAVCRSAMTGQTVHLPI